MDWTPFLIGGALVAAVYPAYSGDLPRLTLPDDLGELRIHPAGTLTTAAEVAPVLQAGHPSPAAGSGILPDSPAYRIDPNVASSPFAGVGSLFVAPNPNDPLGFLGTATPIGRDLILTAAHVVDVWNNDGVADARPQDIVFILNQEGDFSRVIQASKVVIHPDYHGFGQSLNDDLAVIRLAEPLPDSVPIYPLAKAGWLDLTPLIMTGYGESGDGVHGYTTGPSFTEKRTGVNLLESMEQDDEGTTAPEVALWDFEYEGDPARYDVLGIPYAFPNPLETTLGAGDSGGPSFMLNPDDPTDDQLYLAVVNTFSFWFTGVTDHDTPGKFGAGGGGMWLNDNYQTWIRGVPDAGFWWTDAALAAGAMALAQRRARTRARFPRAA